LHRIRHDKYEAVKAGNYFGNNYKFAEQIWGNYFNPLTLEHIIGEKKLN